MACLWNSSAKKSPVSAAMAWVTWGLALPVP